MALGKVILVGAGPGDPGLLTRKAARALANADVLVYDYLAAAPIVALAPPDCERIYVGKKAREHTMRQEDITALIVRLGREGKTVVRLKGGDPYVFGRGGEEAQELAEAGIPFEVIPGITSGIAAPAYAGIPVTHRDHNTAFTIVTGHEDPTKGESTLDWAKLADPHRTLVLYMAMGNLRGIAQSLIANGLDAATPVAVVREGTKPQQETLVATLATVADEVERVKFAAPAIVVVGSVVTLREEIRWFDRGPLFGKRVLVTRPRGQEAEFAERLWELGAQPVLAPLLAVVPPPDERAAREAVENVRSYAWAVFSSVNGVEAFFDRLAELGKDARAFGNTKIAAIGPKTAEALASRGIRVDFVPANYVGEAVAEGLIERSASGERILLYRALEARDVLADLLLRTGRDVSDVAAYTTQPLVPEDFADDVASCDILTFTSAGTVRAFASALGGDVVAATRGKTIACIGPITADAARELGLRVDVVASAYTVDGLLAALTTAPAPV